MRATLNCHQEGRTPLHSACEGGHAKVISVLLAAGATLEAPDNVTDDPDL
jgi:ankyrin repeat protein